MFNAIKSLGLCLPKVRTSCKEPDTGSGCTVINRRVYRQQHWLYCKCLWLPAHYNR